MYDEKPRIPHVLIFPLPLQGPVNCMLKLAELLCLSQIRVTFLNTHHIHRRLLTCTDNSFSNYYTRYPNLNFETVPDGLPEDDPRTMDKFPDLMNATEAVAVPIIREMVACGGVYGPDSESPVTCLIADGHYGFTVDVAAEMGFPLLYFETLSPCSVWTYMCLPKLIEEREIPFKDSNLDKLITSIPGMEGIIRRRDLPDFYRSNDLLNSYLFQQVLKEAHHLQLAQGLILNKFLELEVPILSQLRNICPNTYAIGPLHSHLKARLASTEHSGKLNHTTNTNSIWKEDKSCISWLDSQPLKSVLYVSIGSLAVMTKDQFIEIWNGLVNSGTRFLWVQRPGSILGFDREIEVPSPELCQGTKERGFIVSWAPQEEVLAHPAVGGFFTHSGWNSTLESIVEGKPMICWPHIVDQQVNSRYVGEVWKLGLDMKDTCDRIVVQKMVRELMEFRRDELLQRADAIAQLAQASVVIGGSSSLALARLVEDINSISNQLINYYVLLLVGLLAE